MSVLRRGHRGEGRTRPRRRGLRGGASSHECLGRGWIWHSGPQCPAVGPKGTETLTQLSRAPKGCRQASWAQSQPSRAVGGPSPLGLHFPICRMVTRFLLSQGHCDRQGRVTTGQALLNGAHGHPRVKPASSAPTRQAARGRLPAAGAGLSCATRLQRGGRSHEGPRSSWGQNILEN